MEELITDESLVKKGKMRKFPLDMDASELRIWKENMAKDTRAYLFSIGQPLVYEKDGQMVAEYADGRIEML